MDAIPKQRAVTHEDANPHSPVFSFSFRFFVPPFWTPQGS